MIYKGYNPDILTQKFFEELLFNVYPNRKINSIYPWAGDLKMSNNDKVYFGNCSLKNAGTSTTLFLNGNAFIIRSENPVHFPVCFDSVDDDDLVYFVGFVAQMDNVPMQLVDETAPVNPDYTLKVFKLDLCYHCLSFDGVIKVYALVKETPTEQLFLNNNLMDKVGSGSGNIFSLNQPYGVSSILTHLVNGRLQYDLGFDVVCPVTAKFVSVNQIKYTIKIRSFGTLRNVPDSHTNYFFIQSVVDQTAIAIYANPFAPFGDLKLSEQFSSETIEFVLQTSNRESNMDYFSEIRIGLDSQIIIRAKIKVDN